MSPKVSASPQQLRRIFIATMGALAATLAWLAWGFLKQDAQLAAHSELMRREAAADLAVATLERRLTAVEQDLDRVLTSGAVEAGSVVGDGSVLVEFRAEEVRAWPPDGLAYYPIRPVQADSPEAVAAVGRAARYLNTGRLTDALTTYESLADFKTATVAGLPSRIAGHLGRLAVFERLNDKRGASSAALELDRDIHTGSWLLSAPAYRYLAQEISRHAPARPYNVHLALAAAIEESWHEWKAGSSEAGRRSHLHSGGGVVIVLWRSSPLARAVYATDRSFLDTQPVAPSGIEVTLTNLDGATVLGHQTTGSDRPAIRLASETGLPWNLQVSSAPDATQQAAIRSRRRYLGAGFGVLFAGVLAGGWLISHSMARQLAAARLQSDFVSAVSHEFRTPLTTLCQFSELLKRGRVAREDDRQQYYELLHSESDRLRRLVESLLAFGRLEAGRAPFRLEPTDVETLVRDAAEQFGSSHDLDGHRIAIDVNGSLPAVPADREGLRTVLWNLFENAVKYSPAREGIYVSLSAQSRSVVICVRDDGIGIPVAEHRQIFDRFVRGTAARDRNIRGTGIGLAMVRQIVQAHGGEITVESTPGVGSTFRIALPSASTGVTAQAQGRPS